MWTAAPMTVYTALCKPVAPTDLTKLLSSWLQNFSPIDEWVCSQSSALYSGLIEIIRMCSPDCRRTFQLPAQLHDALVSLLLSFIQSVDSQGAPAVVEGPLFVAVRALLRDSIESVLACCDITKRDTLTLVVGAGIPSGAATGAGAGADDAVPSTKVVSWQAFLGALSACVAVIDLFDNPLTSGSNADLGIVLNGAVRILSDSSSTATARTTTTFDGKRASVDLLMAAVDLAVRAAYSGSESTGVAHAPTLRQRYLLATAVLSTPLSRSLCSQSQLPDNFDAALHLIPCEALVLTLSGQKHSPVLFKDLAACLEELVKTGACASVVSGGGVGVGNHAVRACEFLREWALSAHRTPPGLIASTFYSVIMSACIDAVASVGNVSVTGSTGEEACLSCVQTLAAEIDSALGLRPGIAGAAAAAVATHDTCFAYEIEPKRVLLQTIGRDRRLATNPNDSEDESDY